MKRRVGTLSLFLTALVSGCGNGGDALDLGQLRIHLWQPAGEDRVEDANLVELTLKVDDKTHVTVFEAGAPLVLEDLEIETHGQDLSLELKTLGDALSDGVARSGKVSVNTSRDPGPLFAILGPADVAFVLDDAVESRKGAAWCSTPDGRAFGVAGQSAGTPNAGSTAIVPLEKAIQSGPNPLVSRVGAHCVATDDSLILFGGCDASDDAAGSLELAPLPHGPFQSVDEANTVAGCGSALALDGENLWLVFTDAVELRRLPDLSLVERLALPENRHHASSAVAEGSLLIAGGFVDPNQTQPATIGFRVRQVSGSLQVDSVSALAGMRVYSTRQGPVALSPTGVFGLGQGGPTDARVQGLTLSQPNAQTQLVALPQGAFARFEDGMDRIEILGPNGKRDLDLEFARDGAALISDPGLTVLLAGGGGPLEAFVLGRAP
jgi:hypothetical protein